jgi:hypothetical protein
MEGPADNLIEKGANLNLACDTVLSLFIKAIQEDHRLTLMVVHSGNPTPFFARSNTKSSRPNRCKTRLVGNPSSKCQPRTS